MAHSRPSVSPMIKAQLVEQAGGKCVNPGCSNVLVEFHHIREWHVYKTHDVDHMVAVCGACHDSVNRGRLQISDDDVYAWKGVTRGAERVGHVFIEPAGRPPLLLMGSFALQGEAGLIVFDFADEHRLSFAVSDGDILLLNLRVASFDAETLIDVVDGYVRRRSERIEITSRPGHIKVSAGMQSEFVPAWLRAKLLDYDPMFGIEGMPLIEIKVVRPGVVRVNGIWCSKDHAVIGTNRVFSSVARFGNPLVIVGEGEETVLNYTGPIGSHVFGL